MTLDECKNEVKRIKPQLVGNYYSFVSKAFSIRILNVRYKEAPKNHETIKTYFVEIEYLNNSNNLIEKTSLDYFLTYYH